MKMKWAFQDRYISGNAHYFFGYDFSDHHIIIGRDRADLRDLLFYPLSVWRISSTRQQGSVPLKLVDFISIGGYHNRGKFTKT